MYIENIWAEIFIMVAIFGFGVFWWYKKDYSNMRFAFVSFAVYAFLVGLTI